MNELKLPKADEETNTQIRYPSRLHHAAKRLAKAEGVSLNTILKRSIERDITRLTDMSFIAECIEDSTSLIFGIDINKLRAKLHEKEIEMNITLNAYHKVYLARVLPYEKRVRLFLLEWPDDLDEISMLDEQLDSSIEERDGRRYYNIRKLANNLRIPLTLLGEEYLKTFIEQKYLNEVMNLTKHLYAEEAEEEQNEEERDQSDEEKEEGDRLKSITEKYGLLEEEGEPTEGEDEEEDVEIIEPEEG